MNTSIIASIRDRLLKERETLLDLSARNRLLNTPLRTRNVRNIEIVDEKPAEVFRLLSDGKAMSFLPGIQLSEEERGELEANDVETGGIPQPDEAETFDDRGVASRHSDTHLQTRLTSKGLQKRLFDIWYDARTLEEEQGVNILYLALGLLRWYDADASDIARHAPLVLVPVQLDRSSAADRFHLKGRGEPPSPNLTLQAKMKAEFGFVIEDFHNEDEVDLPAYFAKVAETVSQKEKWEVLPDAMVLGFFSFSKFLMYRDLDPDNWPETDGIGEHPLVAALLRDGFPETDPLIADDADIDDAIPALELNHVVDADSSQAVAIAEAANGRTLVVKGPPGTGKSQTITNIIAATVAKGRSVLFVAEKMAALDVVHRRLQQAGLGDLALELHSNKISKKAVLEELRRTKDASPKKVRDGASVVQKLGESTTKLNAFARRLHTKLQPCGLTPYQIMGRLVQAHDDGGPSGYVLEGAAQWTRVDHDDRYALAEEFAERLRDLGPPPQHVWRGVQSDALDPREVELLLSKIDDLQSELRGALEVADISRQQLGAPSAVTLNDLSMALSYLQAANSLPRDADQSALAHDAWIDGVSDLSGLVVAGEIWAQKRQAISSVLNEAGWKVDYAAIRLAIATKGTSLFRVLDSHYRGQIGLLRSYLNGVPPKSATERLALVDQISAAQEARRAFEVLAPLGEAFGTLWKGEASNWEQLKAVLVWREAFAQLPECTWRLLARADREEVRQAAARLDKTLASAMELLVKIVETLRLDLPRAFEVEKIPQISIAVLNTVLESWRLNSEALTRFIAFASRGRRLDQMGGASLVRDVHDGKLGTKNLTSAFRYAYSDTLRATLFEAWPELRAFDGQSQDRLVSHFRQLDRARIIFAKEEIAAAHSAGRPRANGGVGPLGVLNAEMAKRRGHLPLRKLLERAGQAIQQLKPVFMMSPLSVAQFLKPGGLTFDVLVMDEASQIEPVDALGAVARVEQLVVVGDERQLPPTSFFKKLTGEEDDEDDERDSDIAIQAKDAESILDLCLAKGAPYRMLNWHYRSRHQSLIAVSNKEFYRDKLFIVPSPYDSIAGMGLKFKLCEDAPYERGGSRTNPNEARIIAEAVIRHALETPQLSLGVGTFSVAQRKAILNQLEVLRRANPEAEDFFAANAAEPFFVKNLENIQGDERDVVFISVGYGKTEQGYLAHSFGPLSSDGGERRLNVLISRAKLRCEVFCNFTGAEIDLERTRARGVAALKMFLTFAQTGNFGLGEVTGQDFDSEFEAQVCERLQSLGYDVKAQIGASGFRIDLAVSDPEKPGRFVLGIECDGAQYHSSRSARDRDRLRQQVLEAHGWIIHRIWSTDWYLRPQEELKKVEDAIAAARAEWIERDAEQIQRAHAVPLSFEASREDDHDVVTAIVSDKPEAEVAPERVFYSEASFPVDRQVEPHEAPLADMAAYVVKIVEIEGPVHADEIIARVRILWGLHRAGSRIRAAVLRAIDVAGQRGFIKGANFYTTLNQKIVVRDRSLVESTSLRKPEALPPIEMHEAILKIVDENFGAGRDELILAVSRAFGYSSTSAQLKAAIASEIDELVKASQLSIKGDLLLRSSVD